jgi:hypothetical protein
LALVASAVGIFSRGEVYRDVVSTNLIPGSYGQDLISFVAAMCLLLIALFVTRGSVRREIVAMGILGYFFYAYGIYVIERVYNSLYLLYAAIFTLSFWALVSALAKLDEEALVQVEISNRTRVTSLVVALLQPLVFIPLWVSTLVSLMRSHNRIEYLYSVYILDLCFIMPAFLVLAWLLAKRRPLGYFAAPGMFILGFTLIFSLAVSEAVKPYFGAAFDPSTFWPALGLSALFLAAGILHLKNINTEYP